MHRSVQRYLAFSSIVVAILQLLGCGGKTQNNSGGGTPTMVTAQISLIWDSPARTLEGPTSAQSAIVRILHTGDNDVVQTVPRPASGGTETISIENTPVGDGIIIVDFYNGTNGSGTIMREAEGTIMVAANGQTGVTINGTPTTTVASVQVSLAGTGSVVPLNASEQLILTAKDSNGNIIAGTSTLSWSVTVDQPTIVSLTVPTSATTPWTVTGKSQGNANISVALDGNSAMLPVSVLVPVFAHVANVSSQTITDADLGSLTGAATNLASGTEGPLVFPATGNVPVNVTPAGGTSDALGNASFAPNGSYTIVIYDRLGSTPNLAELELQDAFTATATFEARGVNLIAAGTAVDLYLTAPTVQSFTPADLVASDIQEGAESLDFSPSPGSYTLWIVQAGTQNVLTSTSFTATAGLKRSVYIVNNGTTPLHVVSIDRQ